MTTLHLRKSISRPLLRVGFLFIPLTLVCLGLSPQARAVCQEGCLTNQNTVLGDDALLSNTNLFNTAIGFNALRFNTLGATNTATGNSTLYSNTFGNNNTATGGNVLQNNTTGSDNTATGFAALYLNTTGGKNTAIGEAALFSNTTGSDNIALGYQAGQNLTTGIHNIYMGNAGGGGGESGRIRIGSVGTHSATFIAGISGVTVPDGVGVIVGSNGKLGTVVSSQRFKDNVQPMDKASETILALKPVTFRYKHDLDPEGIPQFGLVAEEVEKVNPDLVARDEQGKPYTVRYEAVNAMLLNEFLKEHRTVQEQQKEIDALKTELKEQGSLIRKVSGQLELGKATPQVAEKSQ